MPVITSDEELARAIQRMRAAGTDVAEYEVKASVEDLPKSTAETISAFANTVGGTIVLGVCESRGFHPATGFVPKTIQAKCAQAACEEVVPPVAADIHVLMFEGVPVVVANIPEAPARQKPCYVRRLGQRNGSFIRTGDGDHRMTPYEIDRFIENQLRSARNDTAIVPEATMDDLDSELLSGWLASERSSSFGRADAVDDMTLLANRRAVAVDEDGTLRPTLAGLMALGSYPQKFFPRLNVVFSSYPQSEKGALSPRGERFADIANLDGPIPQMIVDTLRAVSRNTRRGAVVRDGLREDVSDYPLDAVREAVANALMHRDYSSDGQGEPVEVDLYPDRLEIGNPGGLYGSLTVDRLGGRGGTASRNPALARILEEVPYTDVDGRRGHVVENRGTGYPIIRNALVDALMEGPVIDSSLDGFRIVFLRRSSAGQEGRGRARDGVMETILELASGRESVSTAEVARAAGVSSKTARRYIGELVEEGVLEGVGPLNSPKRRYRLSGRRD